MDVNIQAINFDASEKLVAFVNKKAERLQRHYPDITTVDVKLTVVKPETAMNKEAVISVVAPKNDFVATKVADSFALRRWERWQKRLRKRNDPLPGWTRMEKKTPP